MLAACAKNPEPGGGGRATGGSTVHGGSSATGGSTSHGGSNATGGSTGNGGSSAMGGTLASGGATGSGGSAGPVTLFDFATSDQGWVFNMYQATGGDAGAAVSPYNLAAPGVVPGVGTDGGVAAPTIAADSTVGDPPGSLKVVVTFTGNNQQVNPNINWGLGALQDWTNKVISARVKVDPAVPTFNGGIMLYAQDTTYAGEYRWADFPTDSDWHTYTLDMTNTTSVKPAEIIQFTVQLASATTPTATDDAGVEPFTPTTVTAYIDTITVQ